MKHLQNALRPAGTVFGLLVLWWGLARFSGIPAFLLPGPGAVARVLVTQSGFLFQNMLVTLVEIGLGLGFGTLFGALLALVMVFSRGLQRWLLPLLLLSQAVPVFALAPLLVLWLGFGLASKVLLTVLVIFFPVTAAFYDGLRRTEPGWLDLAQTMGASRLSMLLHVRLMAALPAFGAGLRIAASIAPIGAILGEWAGASEGLGYIMLNANARMQTDVMFAALVLLAVLTVLLWVAVDMLLKKLLHWAPDH
ncbi:ABC transporter permease [Acidocella aminolytica]|jgi:putative hydroxymethylpyrimidine transport system permease protein|uniref:ABC transporter nitrate/sulfonate/bicarbonate permease n=1 Tax=Acidocella aminolytica 101 = DSM 11237 TaxID=1120923 RepID=A0A0D6PGJ1_9PROT|nr:ABC transporter permease [Acidocella aminolytica]GAN79959.1 ABC transporter nitrate/sulfonate/bicarbonate permease [Acidocella aminolytica 101 = DSM 11237]GBQ38247.1 nitrate/sulfonate/bicarbonate ABC transporter permease [Acidocella aminolytica 101 = DSM 11237]SHE58325.1 putative hydroxymethylpyrimidine transport system permease protein [Acidocella aminolytica 101 = DSM 11237]